MLVSLALVLVALLAGIWAGGHPRLLPGFVRDTLVGDSQAQVFQEALDKVDADYYKPVDEDRLLDKGLTAVVGSLGDRFSHYLSPRARTQFDLSTAGRFEGVGLNVAEIPAGLRVVAVFAGGPAARAGLRVGDRIVAVNGRSLSGVPSEAATARIKGPRGTDVRLTVVRGGKRREQTLKRAAVEVPIVQSRLVQRDGRRLGYVSMSQFTTNAGAAVGKRTRKLIADGAKGIVLDLRGNGGGLLDEGVSTASVFLPDGLVVYTKGRNRPRHDFEATGDAIAGDVPVVVLVDRGTASASEIVTGALQDRRRATVVGTRTFGKGVFQEIEGLSNGGALDITVGEYFTPKGRNLGPRDGEPGGITPDVRAADDPKTARDEGLERALRVLGSG